VSDHPTTALCSSSADDVRLRGKSLPGELMGQVSFAGVLTFLVTGRMPDAAETALVDACLVTLMEHGLTPTAISARLTYTSAPEAMQGAVAAGLLSVGSLFVGTVEGCAEVLDRIASADDVSAAASEILRTHRAEGRRLPGFGHPEHTPVDPRTERLRELAREHGRYGPHWRALDALDLALNAPRKRPLPPNATGAIAATLADCGIPSEIMRGFALVSRAGGLIAHIHEEQRRPALHALWQGASDAVPYAPDEEEP